MKENKLMKKTNNVQIHDTFFRRQKRIVSDKLNDSVDQTKTNGILRKKSVRILRKINFFLMIQGK